MMAHQGNVLAALLKVKLNSGNERILSMMLNLLASIVEIAAPGY